MKAQRAADAAEKAMQATRTGTTYDAASIERRNKALQESEVAWKVVEASENKALEADIAYTGATALNAKKQQAYFTDLEEHMNGLLEARAKYNKNISRLALEN